VNKKFKVYQGVGLSKKVVAEVETRKEAKQMAHKLQENNPGGIYSYDMFPSSE